MADIFDKHKRSEIMSKIKSINTKPEITVRKYLYSKGYRYRIHKKGLPGKPDIVLPKYKTVIFVQGCFWHGHSCKIGSGKRKPKSNQSYWNNKIARNIERDKENHRKLKTMGWKVIKIWECATKDEKKLFNKLKPLMVNKDNAKED
ncbi:MAG: DNA mismatch endonuclease Vsr [Thermodesulfovibrionales bacterium]|nr:DNA mismatch endonuclease Vsr [Thermodesulfovibrionales bacterium]